MKIKKKKKNSISNKDKSVSCNCEALEFGACPGELNSGFDNPPRKSEPFGPPTLLCRSTSTSSSKGLPLLFINRC